MIKTNLELLFNAASTAELAEGLAWYYNQHHILQALAVKYHVPITAVCGACAAISPGLPWFRNLQDTETLLSNPDNVIVGVYGKLNQQKALAILSGKNPLDILGLNSNYPKVLSFYLNLAYPDKDLAVTIDRHMKCAAFNITEERDKNAPVRIVEYREISAAVREIAEDNRLLPHQVQAIIWVTWRNLIKG